MNLSKVLLLFSALIFINSSALAHSESQLTIWGKAVQHGEAIGLDVRTAGEVESHPTHGATHIPISDLESKIKTLNKSKRIYVFCESGGRAGRALNTLKSHGFKNVENIKDWRTWNKITKKH